jgi:hypothetical protein
MRFRGAYSMSLEEVLKTASSARPEFDLVTFKQAGLPVYILTIRVLTMEQKPMGAIEEGVLKSVSAGLSTPDDISNFLGLSTSVLLNVFATLNNLELISYIKAVGDSCPKILLTAKGRVALELAATILPQEKTVKICFDVLNRKLLLINTNSLFRPRDMRALGYYEVPSCGSKRPEIEDLSLDEFDKIIANSGAEKERSSKLISIIKIERREICYLPCTMIFYRSTVNNNDIEVSFWQEDGPLNEHENSFQNLNGRDLVGANLIVSDDGESLHQIHQVSESIIAVDTPIAGVDSTSISSQSSNAHKSADITEGRKVLDSATLEYIPCHSHPDLLKQALLDSKSRLMIISPWINHHVVDWQFVKSVEVLLSKGVDVYIGYGIGDVEKNNKSKDAAKGKPDITPEAKRDLQKLADQYKNFKFVYIGNTHQKTLISDDSFAVVTSFNWMSFKGDARYRPRDERGIVIRKKKYIDDVFQDALKLINYGYKGR